MSIFWGLLFIVLDIRINTIDLILPDFIGYILIFTGLTLLAPEHGSFRKARVFAVVMFFVSIPSLIELGSAPMDPAFLKRQLISGLTGDLSALLPREIHSARLLRTTNSRSSIDAHRTQNPQGDEDAVSGEYSDGTVVLILRYASPEEALQALDHKTKTDYSFDGIRKRAETDASFRAEDMPASGDESSSGEKRVSAGWRIEAADRLIQQWWNRGWSWLNVSDRNKGGWSSSILYVVEGYKSSAGAYKSALEGAHNDQSGIKFNPLFPVFIIGAIVDAMMIWAICSGIMALALSSNQYDLMNIARRRRALYMALTVTGGALAMIWLITPEFTPSLFHGAVAGVVVVYALVGMIALVLIMALMQRAANSL
jgi:hypothetical protein